VVARETDHSRRNGRCVARRHLGPKLFGKLQVPCHAFLVGLREPALPRWLDIQREPLGPELVGQPAGRPDQPLTERARTDAHQEPLGCGPGARDRADLHVGPHLLVDATRGPAHRQLAQRGQVAFSEEALGRAGRLLGHIHLALRQALQQFVRWQVDQLDLVRLVHDPVGDGLADHDAGDLSDDVPRALHVLDVERCVDVDAGPEELVDVLPPLRVA